jgi:hypothetical protein
MNMQIARFTVKDGYGRYENRVYHRSGSQDLENIFFYSMYQGWSLHNEEPQGDSSNENTLAFVMHLMQSSAVDYTKEEEYEYR